MRKLAPKIILLIAVGTITIVFGIAMLAVSLFQPTVRFAAIDDAATTAEDTAATIGVLTNDTDKDVATLAIATYTQPEHGYVIKYGSGLRYTPYTDYNGADAFTYTIENADGETATATVTVTITAVNDTPHAYDDVATTDAGYEIIIDVVFNDADADDDLLTIESYTAPDHGTLYITEDNRLRYVPDDGFVGTDDFTYDVADPDGASDRATVTMTVAAVEP